MKTKTTLLLILIFSFCIQPAKCQKVGSDVKVKSIIVTEERLDMLVKKQFKESETYFDIHGNVLELVTYKSGKLKKHFKYKYDSDNNKIIEEEYDPSGRLKESTEYKYVNGWRSEKIVYDPNKKIKSRKLYVYTAF